jgi:hypothetical protein
MPSLAALGGSKRSAKTRSWEIANKKARLLEEELDQTALGVEAPKNPEPITIEAAAELYLKDMVQREFSASMRDTI